MTIHKNLKILLIFKQKSILYDGGYSDTWENIGQSGIKIKFAYFVKSCGKRNFVQYRMFIYKEVIYFTAISLLLFLEGSE